MLLNYLLFILNGILVGFSYLLPDYTLFPLPESGLTVISNAFGFFNLLGTLPVARVIWPYLFTFIIVWKFVFIWNLTLKIIGVIPFLSGLKALKIQGSGADEYAPHPVDRREWHIPVKGVDTNKEYKIKVRKV